MAALLEQSSPSERLRVRSSRKVRSTAYLNLAAAWQVAGYGTRSAVRAASGNRARSHLLASPPLKRKGDNLGDVFQRDAYRGAITGAADDIMKHDDAGTGLDGDISKTPSDFSEVQSTVDAADEEPGEHVYVLDGQNILGWTNQGGDRGWKWEQLLAAGSYYKSRGHDVMAFLPYVQGDDAADLEGFRQKIGDDCIVTTPPQSSVHKFMIKYVKDHPKTRFIRMVSNSRFRDHTTSLGVSGSWIEQNTVKFIFASGDFIPQNFQISAGGEMHTVPASPEPQPSVYVLDGENLLGHSNSLRRPAWSWEQLFAACRYYQNRGHRVQAFLPWLHSDNEAKLDKLQQLIGDDGVVTIPRKDTGDKFMVNYLKYHRNRYNVRVVTNDLFRNHSSSLGLSEGWLRQYTVKFVFAAGSFIPQSVKGPRVHPRQERQSEGRYAHGGASSQHVYILDGRSILRNSNQLKNWPFWNWDQLITACSYYKSLKHQVLIFLPKRQLDSSGNMYSAQLEGLRQSFGLECIVMTPGGCDDKLFMINYAREHGDNRTVRIVTNYQFSDWGLSESWVNKHLIKFLFAAGRFVPSIRVESERYAEAANQRIYALDGPSILRHSDKSLGEASVSKNWEQLTAAASFYKSCGHKVFIFLPRAELRRYYNSQLQSLRQQFGSDCIVITPAGYNENAFMINYAKNYPKIGLIRIVTNDDLRSHDAESLVSESWWAENTVNFTFTAGNFVSGDAKALQQELLEARIRSFGPEHPDTLSAKNHLSSTLLQSGDLEGAEKLQREMLAVRIRTLGYDHPDTIWSKDVLVSTLHKRGDVEAADELVEQVASHTHVQLHELTNQSATAKPSIDVEVQVGAVEEHPNRATLPAETFEDAKARAELLFQAGQYDRAIRMFEIAQTLPSASLGEQGPTEAQRLMVQYYMACCCAQMGNNYRAMELLRKYIAKRGDPMNQIRDMLIDPDLANVRVELKALKHKMGPLEFLKEASARIGVELKEDGRRRPEPPPANDNWWKEWIVGEEEE